MTSDAGAGRLFVTGEWWQEQEQAVAMLYRLTAAGVPDPTFSGDGLVAFRVGTKSTDARDALGNADGSVFVTGTTMTTVQQPYLAKFRNDGSLDTAFARDGSTRFDGLPSGGGLTPIGTTTNTITLAGIMLGASGMGPLVVSIIRICRTSACHGVLADGRTFGTTGADDIIGTWSSDEVEGKAAADELTGNGGNDELSGGGGADRLVGGLGADELLGGEGNDTVGGGSGGDVLEGGSGNDVIGARDGRRDTISCGAGTDRVVADVVDRVLAGCESVRRFATE